MLGKPTICTEICDIGFEGKLEGSMERVSLLTKFDIGVIDRFRKARGNFVEEIIPKKLGIRTTTT
jgi:hypothetical protein